MQSSTLFALAFGVRLVYLASVGTTPDALFHPDTPKFVDLALSPGWWQGSAERMPIYPIFLHLHFIVFGATAFWAPVVTQMAVDSAACVGIARLADVICRGSGRFAGPVAALNPTQIVMSGVLLGDSLFVACLTGGFLALARWRIADPQSNVGQAVRVGVWFGLALLNRAVVWPFLPVLAAAMYVAALRSEKLRAAAWRGPAAAMAVVLICAAPIVVRNWVAYGTPALSSQGGMHMALWWYPLVREVADGTPYAVTTTQVLTRYQELVGTDDGSRPFENEAIYSQLARDGISELKSVAVAVVKAWATGAAINLAAPATLMIPAVMDLPRIGFYATPGEVPFGKIVNFVTASSSQTYQLWLAGGVVLEWPVRFIALMGLVAALSTRGLRGAGLFAVLWIGYVLAVQGPVASAKYRLPVEPLVAVLAGIAATRFVERRARD